MDLITLALSKKFTSDAIEAKADKTDIVQSDWNQNDETAIDYIKNRPFYEDEETEKIILQEATYTCMIDQANIPYIQLMPCPLDLKEGNVYDVYVNGKLYTLKCNFGALQEGQIEQFYLGDRDFSNVPIFIRYISLISLFNISFKEPLEENTATICIKERIQNIKKIDRKFVNNIAGMDVKGNTFLIDDVEHTALNGAEIFNDYGKNIAVGQYSHAEGTFTAAVGDGSHAEGCITTASGMYSHAEGYNTKAIASSSHAEGASTKALGLESHAEGKNTIAAGEDQHAQGRHNIEDTEGKYAHIVGNGTYATRSNAHTLDWDGNAWYQGDIYIGSTSGTNKDEGSKKLATEEYINTEVANLVNSAPETLDTLGELATALEENSDIIEVLNSAITNKADKTDIVQSDWNQNDEASPDYIKNRPFYNTGEYEEIELLKDEMAYKFKTYYVLMSFPSLQENHTYKLIFDNEEFICTAILDADNTLGLGNSDYLNNNTWEEGKEPFYLQSNGTMAFLYKKDSSLTYLNVSVYETKEKIHQIEKKYIENHLVGHKANQKYIYNDTTYVSQDGAEIFNSLGNIAIGQSSHAEGSSTIAFGDFSHAEGLGSEAFGTGSHAGGTSSAYGAYSFAHGAGCIASGARAWAQNNGTEAFGNDSTAEGIGTIANRGFQHVQGRYNIPEDRVYQKVIFTMNSNSPTYNGETIVYLLDKEPTFNKVDGKYTTTRNTTPVAYKDLQPNNVFLFEDTTETIIDKYYFVRELLTTEDDEEGTTLYQWNLSEHKSQENREKGKYAHIVGNGEKSNGVEIRSNAYTLDWDGNAWYQGDVYVGSTSKTNKDEGSKKLITADEVPQSDYNQNDETAIDFIKNRPFYSTGEYEEIEILKDGTAMDLTAYFGSYVVMECPALENKHTYRIVFNGQEFICTSAMNKDGHIGVGDINYINNGTWEDGKEPFYMNFYGGSCFIYLKDSKLNSKVSIYETKEIIHSIDKKFIKEHLAGNKADQEYIYEDKFYTSKINAEYFNDVSNIAIGENSHAEGKATVALGDYSHAEGYASKAIGRGSHAGGSGGKAIGDYSFAHYSTASGDTSTAFGSQNEAYGRGSFVEGLYNIANVGYQHVQGKYNIPEERLHRRVIFAMDSNYSPTYDGEKIVYLLESTPTFDYFTGKYMITGVTTPTTYKDLQPNNTFLFENTTETTIDGYYLVESLIETKEDESGNTLYKWNLCQYSSEDYRDEGKYAHIVGNGNYNVNSNAYTLDWKGNGWYQGTVEATGLILSSPNGTRFKITVGDDGVLTSTEFTEEEKPFRPGDVYKSITSL